MIKEIILYCNHDKFPSWSCILAFFHMPTFYLDAYLCDENIPSGGAKGYVTGFFFPFFIKVINLFTWREGRGGITQGTEHKYHFPHGFKLNAVKKNVAWGCAVRTEEKLNWLTRQTDNDSAECISGSVCLRSDRPHRRGYIPSEDGVRGKEEEKEVAEL